MSSRPSSPKTKLKEFFIMKQSSNLTRGALIAALYAVLTLLSNALGLANGAIQLRISEALTILPMFTTAAIPGLFIGCLISNLLTDGVIANIVFGSVATLIGALLTRVFKKNTFLACLMPVLSNTIIVPFIIIYSYGVTGTYWYFALTVFIGEAISVFALGLPLASAIKRRPELYQ